MKFFLTTILLCVGLVLSKKVTEVVTRDGEYVIEETITTDIEGQREEHRLNITDSRGMVTQQVSLKLFSDGLVVSYRSNETLCFIAPLEKTDSPVPVGVFDEVSESVQTMATKGSVVEEGFVTFGAVDGRRLDNIPQEAVDFCEKRTIQAVWPGTHRRVSGNKVKRSYYGVPPILDRPSRPVCGRDMRYKKTCAAKTRKTCCKMCELSTPYCYKDYYYVDVPCSYSSYGHGKGGY